MHKLVPLTAPHRRTLIYLEQVHVAMQGRELLWGNGVLS